jgi:two-component system sensor histidine kinase/response regulator
MDLEMPQMDGHEATIALRKDPRFNSLPVIAMTAHALAEIREQCLAEGMQDYVTKPIDPDKLYSTLARWLGHAMPARATSPQREAVALPGLSGIDSVLGLRHVAGNTALYLQLLERFRTAQRNAVQEIREDAQNGLHGDASARAHALRGVAGNVGARDVQACAHVVEDLLRTANPDPADALEKINALDSAMMLVLAGLDRYFDGVAPAAIKVLPSAGENVGEAIARLRRLLEEFSGDTTDYFDSVRAILATALPAPALDRLAGHLARYEFDDAVKILASLDSDPK